MSVEITKLRNPFKGEVYKKELVQLGTKDVMGEDAVKTVMEIEELGKKKYTLFFIRTSKFLLRLGCSYFFGTLSLKLFSSCSYF